MKILEIKVYSIKELKKESKEKAIEKYRNNCNIELDFWNEAVTEGLTEKFWKNVKLQYSLGYSQGDGLSFSGNLDLEGYLKNKYSVKLPQWKIKALVEYIYSVGSKGNTGHYQYAHENQIEYEENYQDKERPHLDKLWQKVLKEIKSDYMDLCKEFEKQGYNEIEYQQSDDYIIENFENNEYTFLEDGKMFNG